MSWGNKILVVFIAFGSMISYMVYRCATTPVNLVSEQYYKEELAYQKVIDGTRQANALSGKLELSRHDQSIILRLPAEMKGKLTRGTVFFYCPSDITRDRSLRLTTDALGRQEIAARLLRKGHYTVKVSWETGGINYFIEQPLVIN
ncbi:MAG: FixH family protein [Bacteroidota bacterium]|nr:FixH family protein [Bacteroidota bacterium]